MTTQIEEQNRKEIDTVLHNMNIHTNICSKAIIEDALILGRHFSEIVTSDLDRLHAATHIFYNKCTCKRK